MIRALAICLLLGLCSNSCLSAPQAPPADLKQVVSTISEALFALNKCQHALRLTGSRLAELSKDSQVVSKLTKDLELAKEESYPAIAAAEKLKSKPFNLKAVVRLYLGLRFMQERSILLASQLSQLKSPEAVSLSGQILDASQMLGKASLRWQPYMIKVIEAYQVNAPENSIESSLFSSPAAEE